MSTDIAELDDNQDEENKGMSLAGLHRLAVVLSKGIGVPDALKGKPDDVFAIIGTADEMGIPPWSALRYFHVIKGRITLSAKLLISLCHQNPEICLYFKLVKSTATEAIWETQRRGYDPVSMTWTIEMAKRALLLKNDIWMKFPEAMLRARAATDLINAIYPDIGMGMPVAEEQELTEEQFRSITIVQPVTRKAIAAPVAPSTPAAVEPPPVKIELNAAQSEIKVKIEAAQTKVDLEALVPLLKGLPEDQRPPLRRIYTAQLDLVSATAQLGKQTTLSVLTAEAAKLIRDASPENVFNEEDLTKLGERVEAEKKKGNLATEDANKLRAQILQALKKEPWAGGSPEATTPVPTPEAPPLQKAAQALPPAAPSLEVLPPEAQAAEDAEEPSEPQENPEAPPISEETKKNAAAVLAKLAKK